MISNSKFNDALAQLPFDDIVNECLQDKAQSVVENKSETMFEDLQTLIDFMSQYAKSSGFKVCRKLLVPKMVAVYSKGYNFTAITRTKK